MLEKTHKGSRQKSEKKSEKAEAKDKKGTTCPIFDLASCTLIQLVHQLTAVMNNIYIIINRRKMTALTGGDICDHNTKMFNLKRRRSLYII